MAKTNCLKLLIAAFLFAGAIATAHAQLLTFDTLPSTTGGTVPNGYGSLNWVNFSYLDYTADLSPSLTASGYHTAAVSGHQVAFNGFGNAASVNSASLFDFNSLWLAGAWNDGLNVKIEGFHGVTLLYSNTFVVNSSVVSFISLNYLGVDQVTFSSFGGTPNAARAIWGSGIQFAMDNVQLNAPATAVPEPSTYGLAAAAAILGVVTMKRRRIATVRA